MSFDPNLTLVDLVNQIVKSSVTEALTASRQSATLVGTVEDLDDETFDVAYVRTDGEATASDPTQTDHWGDPGVFPATRLGETTFDEQVRVTFDAVAGASALRTGYAGIERSLQVDSTQGIIRFLAGETVVGYMDVNKWELGLPGDALLRLDPIGGLRFRDANDVLVGQLEPMGYTIRDGASGLVTAEMHGGHFRLVDPAGTDDIEMVTSSAGTLPNPKYVSAVGAGPSTTVAVPSAATFTTQPPDDYELYHAIAVAGVSQAATWTPPAGTTERVDTAHNTGTATLSVGLAERDPASGAAGTYTSSTSNWSHVVATHVVVRGGGATSPSYRSLSEANYGPTTAQTVTLTHPQPSGVIQGDALIAIVSMLNMGGSVPVGWTTPEGWIFLGANFRIGGSGASLSAAASGAWVKLATASEPANYDITINFGAGSKRLHAVIVAIQNPTLIAGGAHIRMSGHPIRRLLAQNELTAASATLCDFQSIPAGYDHLELVYEALSDRATDALRNIRMRFNNDSTAGNYRWQVNRDNGISTSAAGTQDRILIGAVDGSATNSESGGIIRILGYARPHRRFTIGDSFHITSAGDLVDDMSRSLWLNATTAIDRVTVAMDAGTTLFNTGSRAYLYGY